MDINSALKAIKNRKYAAEERAYEINEHLSSFEEYNTIIGEIHRYLIEEIKGDTSAKKRKELAEKKLDLFLLKLGFTREDLSPRYFCKKCNDTGFINGEKCDCLSALLDEAPQRTDSEMTFENADPSVNAKLMEYCKKYVSEPQRYRKNMFISGAAGTGKTFALNAIKNAILSDTQSTNSVLFYSAFDIEREFLKIHLSDPFSGEKAWNRLISAEYLLIDDLGTEPLHTNVTVESFFNLFDKRAINYKHTVTTTNLTETDLIKRYTARTFSRLTNAENTLAVKLTGNDLRHRK